MLVLNGKPKRRSNWYCKCASTIQGKTTIQQYGKLGAESSINGLISSILSILFKPACPRFKTKLLGRSTLGLRSCLVRTVRVVQSPISDALDRGPLRWQQWPRRNRKTRLTGPALVPYLVEVDHPQQQLTCVIALLSLFTFCALRRVHKSRQLLLLGQLTSAQSERARCCESGA
eukprot:152718-Amphidinium_carterae.1